MMRVTHRAGRSDPCPPGSGARVLVALVLILMLLAAGSATMPPVARAASGAPLPFQRTAFDMVTARGRVYISGGTGEAGVQVHSFSGAFVKRLTIPGASGLELIGDELFVAATDADRIDVVDTTATPPTIARSISIGSLQEPRDLVYAAGRLWFNALDESDWVMAGVDVDASGLPDAVALPGIGSDTRLAAGGPPTDIVFATNPFVNPATLLKYDMSTETPSLVDQRFAIVDAARSLAASRDGQRVFLPGRPPATPISSWIAEVSPGTLDVDRIYEGDDQGDFGWPTAVAPSPARDGILAGGGFSGSYGTLAVWELDDSTARWQRRVQLPGTAPEVSALAWSADGMRLFAVIGPGGDPGHELFVFHPWAERSSLTLGLSAKTVDHGERITVKAHLTGGATNRVVRIYAKTEGDRKRLLKHHAVDAKGTLSVRVAPRAHTTYWATYAGDPWWRPAASRPRVVQVRARATVAMIGRDGTSGAYALYRYASSCAGSQHTDCPVALGKVAPKHAGSQLWFRVQVRPNRSWKTVFTSRYALSPKSTARVFFWYRDRRIIGIPSRVQVRFDQDGDHLGDTSPWTYFKVVR